MGWYRYIKPIRSRADRIRAAKRSPANLLRIRNPPKIRNPQHIFYKTYSSAFYINGYKAKVITRYGIAEFFNVPKSTIHSWDKLGVLPEPFAIMERGTSTVPVYLAAQIRCLAIVVRDLVKDGYVSIQWNTLHEHVIMLQAGYDEVLCNFNKRLKSNHQDEHVRKGIEFID